MHCVDVYLAFVCCAGVHEGFEYGFICILQLDVFADKGYVNLALRVAQPVEEGAPVAQVRLLRIVYAQMLEHHFVELLLFHIERHLVDGPGVYGLDDVTRLHIAEERHFAAYLRSERMLGAAYYYVRMHSRLLKGLHGMLGRLGLELLRGAQVRDIGQMDGGEVILGEFPLQLTDGLHEGLGFHIAHGAAYLGYDYVELSALAQQEHASLYLVSDMRDYLYGLAQIGPLALLRYDSVVYLAGGDVIGLGGVYSEEPLVMAKVQVSLGSVVGDIALPVLVRVQGSRVYVDVGIEFLNGDTQAARLQKFGQRGRDDSFAQR